MAHLKRLAVKAKWPMNKKEYKWIARPMAGPHPLDKCMTLGMIVKDVLRYANTNHEVKLILNKGSVMVNGRVRKEYRFPIGIFDIIDILETKESYEILYESKGKFYLKPIKDNSYKITKIIGKTLLKGKKLQLNLFCGQNVIVEKDNYNVGDSLIIDLEKNSIKKHLKLEENALVYLIEGNHIGKVGIIKKIKKFKTAADVIVVEIDKHIHETLKDYAVVVDKSFLGENESDEKDKD